MEPRPTAQQIRAKWEEMAPLIDRVQERTGAAGEFPVFPASSLYGDDAATSPYHLSHAVRMCITAGVDHLHAVSTLVVRSGLVHVAAPSTLTRGALETLGTAFWMLHPSSRDERVLRSTAWHVKNAKDGHNAARTMGKRGERTLEDRLDAVQAPALARGLAGSKLKGYTSTEAVRYADEHGSSELGVMLLWQLASGFAHGRPWAYLAASDREESPTEVGGIVDVKLTANDMATLAGPLAAVFLLEDVLRLYDLRARPRG